MKNKIYDVCIIGAGVIGASIARELSRYNLKVLVLEQNQYVGRETTEGNSGIIHGGFDPTPGKLNAKLNLKGRDMYHQWMKEMDFSWQKIDTLVIAFNTEEKEILPQLYERGLINGLQPDEMEVLSREEVLQIEPNLNPQVEGAFLCRSSYIVDPVKLTETLFENAIKNGVSLQVNSQVTDIKLLEDGLFEILVNDKKIHARKIVNAAGHYCDTIASYLGYKDYETFTRRGQYRVISRTKENYVNNLICMIPSIYGKGVLVAPTMDGHILIGPTAEDNVAKTDTRVVTKELFDYIGDIGRKIIPSLDISKTIKTYAGSRSIIKELDDFYIQPAHANKNFIHVAGIKSPGLSSAPAIAELVASYVIEGENVGLNPNFDPYQKSYLAVKLTKEE